MDQNLLGALLVFLVLFIGVFAGGWLFIRVKIDESDDKSNFLRSLFCLSNKELPIKRIQIARSPSEEELETGGGRNLFLHLENIRDGFKFNKDGGGLSSPISPGIKMAFKKSLRRLASSPSHREANKTFTPTILLSPANSKIFPMNEEEIKKKQSLFILASPTEESMKRRNSF